MTPDSNQTFSSLIFITILRSKIIIFTILIYSSISHGDICHINGLSDEDLKNLSYIPPSNELISNEQDRKAWQTFVENYETPVNKVQDWYNSIVDKDSADAAAKAFNKKIEPVLKKFTGNSGDMKKQVLSIPASPEMRKFIFGRILQLQGRLLLIFAPMQNEEKADTNTRFKGSTELFEIICGLSSPPMITISKFIVSRNETQEKIEAALEGPWSPSL